MAAPQDRALAALPRPFSPGPDPTPAPDIDGPDAPDPRLPGGIPTRGSADLCAKCGGAGYIVTARGAVKCACQVERDNRARFQSAGIPRKFLAKTLAGFRPKNPAQRDILAFSRDFLRSFRGADADHATRGLMFRGREGTGKTHLAVAILKDAMARGFTGLYWNVPDLFLELRRLMDDRNPAGRTEADLFDEARRVDLLVLDDLGAERTSDYVLDRLYVLVNGRYQNDTATIVTTNRTPEEMRQQVGPRIASRLLEMCAEVEFPEGDYRRLNLK